MDLREYFAVLRKRWISIAALTLIGVALAAFFTARTPASYTATAQDFVAITSSSAGGDTGDALQSAQFAQFRVKSYTLIVSSPAVVDPVVKELGLPYSGAALAGKVSATNPPLTVLLDVAATDGDPQVAATIATATAIQLGKVIEQLETPMAGTTAPVKVTLTQPAVVPSSPSSPKKTINYALGLLVGLGLGVALAFVRASLDNTVKSGTQVAELLDSQVLGEVLLDRKSKTRLLTVTDTTSAWSEGYRTVRTSIGFVNVDNPPRVIAITSSAPADGKSTVASNLAVTLAQAGFSTVLVDADLRRPRVAHYLDLDNAVGLTDLLTNKKTMDAVLVTWGRGLISVLPSGPIPPNPSEMLSSHRMEHALLELRNRFDYVIVDAPPLLAVADAAVLSARTDGALLVVRYGRSTREHVVAAGDALERVNGKLLGIVFNGVPASYGYGYGYQHGEKVVRKHRWSKYKLPKYKHAPASEPVPEQVAEASDEQEPVVVMPPGIDRRT